MTTALRPAWPAPDELDRCQREWELAEALKAARRLQERLEMLGDRRADVHRVLRLRNDLARELLEVLA